MGQDCGTSSITDKKELAKENLVRKKQRGKVVS